VTSPVKRGSRPGTVGASILRLGVLVAGVTLVTAWLSSELVYQVRVTLDDDGGLVPFASKPGREQPERV